MAANEFWISQDKSRGRGGSAPTYGGRRRAPDLPSRIRAAERVPEAVVKIGKPYQTQSRVKLALDYISRGLEEPLELKDGSVLIGDDDRGDMKDLAEQWASNFRDRKNARNAIPIILSAPPGSNPDALKEIAREWGQEVLGDEYDYAFALHTDEAHPHVHFVAVRARANSRDLGWSRAEVDEMRVSYARLAREHGIPMNATPRETRGRTERGEDQAQRHARLRLGSSLNDEGAAKEVLSGLKTGDDEDAPVWWTAMEQRAASERAAYESLSKACERIASKLGEDQAGMVTGTSKLLSRQSMALRLIATRRSQMRQLATRLNLPAMKDQDNAAKILAKAYRAERSDREREQGIPAPATGQAIDEQLRRFEQAHGDRLVELSGSGDKDAEKVQGLMDTLRNRGVDLDR